MPGLNPIGRAARLSLHREPHRWRNSHPAIVVLTYLILFVVLNNTTDLWETVEGLTLGYAPTALSLGLLLRFGWRFAPAILLGRWLCDFWLHPLPVPWWAKLSLAFIPAFGYGLAAYLYEHKLKLSYELTQLRDVSYFVLLTLLVPLFVAPVGVALLAASDSISWFYYRTYTLNWLGSNLVSISAFVPFLLVNAETGIKVLATRLFQPTTRERIFREFNQKSGFIIALQIALPLILPFAILSLRMQGGLHLMYFCFLPAIWASLQYGLKGATASVFAIALSTAIGVSSFNIASQDLAELQVFVFALALTGLFTGAGVSEKNKVQKELQSSEERFRQLAENIPQVFRIASLDSQKIIYVSPAYEAIWGRSCQSLYQQPTTWLEAVHPQDKIYAIAAHTQQLQGEPTSEEYRILRPDSSIRWIWDRTFPIRNDRGKIYCLAGITQDITERKQVEEEAFNAMAKEKELSELRTRIITTTSHEFRTPLTTIFSSAELLEYYSQKWTEAEKLEHLRQIQESVQHMTQLLDDLLLIGQADARQLHFTPVSLEVVQFTRELVTQIQQNVLSGQKIIFVSQQPSLQALIDSKLLRQILGNLLSNSLKYSSNEAKIQLGLFCQKDWIVFQIKDSGIGIPEEDKSSVYKSFHRGKNVGNLAGTGLGLTVVKKCVDLHQGIISFESKVGIGTQFTIRLPLKLSTESALPSFES